MREVGKGIIGAAMWISIAWVIVGAGASLWFLLVPAILTASVYN